MEGEAAMCWGANDMEQLGNVDQMGLGSIDPVQVDGLTTNVIDVKTGRWHSCALLDTGKVWCWGWNIFGQLGDGQAPPL